MAGRDRPAILHLDRLFALRPGEVSLIENHRQRFRRPAPFFNDQFAIAKISREL